MARLHTYAAEMNGDRAGTIVANLLQSNVPVCRLIAKRRATP